MCIFNHPVKSVLGTRILVCQTCDGRQLTCYENMVGDVLKKDIPNNAMILPFPTSTKSKDTLQFVDLSKCPDILRELDEAFPLIQLIKPPTFGFTMSSAGPFLRTMQVGSYVCSVAQDLKDIRRINPDIFQVSTNVDKLLEKHYSSGFGFVICQLKKQGRQHPIAFVHSLIKENQLFVPTRHEHGDGEEAKQGLPHWDHYIFSSNTTEAKEAGTTPAELKTELEAEAALRNKQFYLESGVSEVKDASVLPYLLLGKLPIPVVFPSTFRRLRIQGERENGDLLLTFKPSTEQIVLPVAKYFQASQPNLNKRQIVGRSPNLKWVRPPSPPKKEQD